MSFLDHIRRCNAHDIAQFRPWFVGAERAGWIHREFAPEIDARPDLFVPTTEGWRLADALATPAARTAAVETFLLGLKERGTVRGWRGERYPVTPDFERPGLLDMERAAVPLFGVRAYGIHLTGFVRRADGLHIWVPQRALDKPTFPGELDNTVAGGQPAGLGLFDNMVKECGEEASIPPEIAHRAIPVGCITYCYQSGPTLKPDVQYVFDLELPEGFECRANDGEVEGFELMPARRVFELVRDTTAFKYNCNLVLIDFFVRHGMIAADDPDYFRLCEGLRAFPRGPAA